MLTIGHRGMIVIVCVTIVITNMTIYIYVERTFWVYFVPSPNSIISPPRSNRYIGAILKNKSLWLRNNFSMMNKSAWWEGAGGAANF